jgi:hypothetical protein
MMIRDLITEVLSENSHTTTGGTITALVNIKRLHRKLIPVAVGDVRSALNAMVRRGDLVEDIDPQRIVRYRLRALCYALCAADGLGWRVVRLHAAGETIIAESMTEAEARCCVTALNELDRKVASIKARTYCR